MLTRNPCFCFVVWWVFYWFLQLLGGGVLIVCWPGVLQRRGVGGLEARGCLTSYGFVVVWVQNLGWGGVFVWGGAESLKFRGVREVF